MYYDFQLEKTVDEKILLKQFKDALENGSKKGLQIDVTNTDRSLGTIFGAEITKTLWRIFAGRYLYGTV